MRQRKTYKVGKRQVLTAVPLFTPDGLRTIIEAALGRTYAPLGETEVVDLCRTLNVWHAYFYRAQEERKFNDIVDKVRKGLTGAATLMQPILEDLDQLNQTYQGRDQVTVWKRQQVHDLARCLTPTGMGFLQHKDLPDQARNWMWLVKVLPVDIAAAIRPTNPKYRGGHTKGGPLSRVLSGVIPGITGERVSSIAVGNQLGNKA